MKHQYKSRYSLTISHKGGAIRFVDGIYCTNVAVVAAFLESYPSFGTLFTKETFGTSAQSSRQQKSKNG